MQEIKNQASRDELEDTVAKLEKLQKQEEQYNNDIIVAKDEIEIVAKDEIEKAKKVIFKAKSRIKRENEKACLLVDGVGMTKSEVISAIGEPTIHTYSGYLYGTVNIVFSRSSGLLSYVLGCKKYK